MRLVILAVGKLKDPHVEALCAEYERRARPFIPVERIACKDSVALWARAEGLGGRTVLLDERGERPSSRELAGWLGTWRSGGTRTVGWLIGGADGFDDADRRRADRVLSLSALTLPHRLAQLMLCEQLYRAGTILAGHPYHHG